jgi:hypothetical protein
MARDRIPAAYADRDTVAAGGLMSYGTDLADTARQIGVYADTQPELGRASETVVGAVDRFATNHSAAAAASSR